MCVKYNIKYSPSQVAVAPKWNKQQNREREKKKTLFREKKRAYGKKGHYKSVRYTNTQTHNAQRTSRNKRLRPFHLKIHLSIIITITSISPRCHHLICIMLRKYTYIYLWYAIYLIVWIFFRMGPLRAVRLCVRVCVSMLSVHTAYTQAAHRTMNPLYRSVRLWHIYTNVLFIVYVCGRLSMHSPHTTSTCVHARVFMVHIVRWRQSNMCWWPHACVGE